MQVRTRQASLVTALAVAVIGLGGMAFAQGGSEIGSWKVNLAKSTYSPGPPQKSSTTKFEVAGAAVKLTVDSVDGDGTVRHWVVTAAYDGKDVAITGNSQNGDTMARTRVDANTVRAVYKRAGKVSVTQTSVVSVDGKTRTVTTTGTNAAGQAVNNVVVYDRQ